MKRFLLLALLVVLASSASAQIARVSANCTGTSSCTSTGNAIGDLEIAIAGRNASATPPTVATGWTDLGSANINGTSTADSSIRLACKVATGTSEASNTFTNADKLVVMVYNGQAAGTTATCASAILGTPSFFTSTVNTTTTTETFNSITSQNASSWIVGLGYCSACTAGIGTAPATMANRSSVTGPPAAGGHDTNGTAASFSSANVTLTTAGRILTATVEIKAASVATPTFGTNGGTFGTSASTTISTGTSGATLCYTTDGSTPAATTPGTCSTGSTYSSAVTVTVSGTTVKAIATKTAWTNSSVATSSTFTINPFLPNLSLLGVSGPGAGGLLPPSLRQAMVSCTGTVTPTSACNFSSGATAGDAVIVFTYANNIDVPCSVASTPANTFVLWAKDHGAGAGVEEQDVFVATNVASGTNAIVATCTGATSFIGVSIYDVKDATTADVSGNADGTGTAVSVATTQPVGSSSEYFACAEWTNEDFVTQAAGTGWTSRSKVFNSAGSLFLGMTLDKDTNTGLSGAQTCTATLGASHAWAATIVGLSNSAAQGNASHFVDFEGLTNASAPTVAQLISSLHGPQVAWDVSNVGSVLTGATAAQLSNFVNSLQLGASLFSGSGSLGLRYTTGAAGGNYLLGVLPTTYTSLSYGHWWKTNVANNDSASNAYSLTQVTNLASDDYVMPQLQPSGSALALKLECHSGPSAGSISVSSGTLYWLTLVANTNGGTDQFAVYDSAGSQVGSTISCAAEAGSHPMDRIRVGITGAETTTSGKTLDWDNIKINTAGTFPLTP